MRKRATSESGVSTAMKKKARLNPAQSDLEASTMTKNNESLATDTNAPLVVKSQDAASDDNHSQSDLWSGDEDSS